MKFDIIGKRYWFFLISGVLILISVIALATAGLKPGIEFSSGSMLTVTFAEEVSYDDVRDEITAFGYTDAIVQETSSGDFLIRTKSLSDIEKKQITAGLETAFGETSEASFISVDPKAASETTRNAIIAVLVASVGILLYITWAFRRMPNPFRYGTCAVIALIHDAIVALGIFSILGALLDWETNLMFITGLLAVIGYSVNNMVVIFDRIRENTIKGIHPEFDVTVNGSLIETLSRSMNTSLTTIITVLAILIFVGSTIQNFAIVLLIGIVIGTFDSIFVAPALLVVWDKGEWHRFLPWKRGKKA
ncbi:MAG: protein translocase subunit SecF [Dehalococcoidales bacterium]|nr:protein translocase subunit SecF [Dehalococcoidales bacterium]